jgi:hypothetical protein
MSPAPDIPALLNLLASPHLPTAIRAARDLRWLSESDPAALYPHRKPLIRCAMNTQDLRVRWNLITAVGHLPLKGSDHALVIDWLFTCLDDPSGLVRTKSLQALFDLSATHPTLRTRILPFAHRFLESGTPAMRARARHLVKLLTK